MENNYPTLAPEGYQTDEDGHFLRWRLRLKRRKNITSGSTIGKYTAYPRRRSPSGTGVLGQCRANV